jgi:hypothetical protein
MAKYDLSSEMRRAMFLRRVHKLIEKKCFVELTELTERSIRQNNYLHLILSYYAIEFGYTLEYTKRHIFKILVNPDTFIIERVNEKTGEMYKDLKSSAEVTKDDMSLCIDRFKDHSAQGGLILPEPDNLIYLKEIMESIEYNKQYL